MRVKLDDVANESREVLRGGKRGLPVIGLEHLAPDELVLTAWDTDGDNTFTKTFQKGQMLFGRRRAYLKKAALAPFDGICSGDITVIEAVPDKLLPELLPFIIQNDTFFDYAVGKSAGSLSPRVKWEHLSQFEFELPPLAEQHKLADLLWAANAAQEAYKKLLAATDALVKSRFIEMFGDPVTNPMGWERATIENLCSIIVDCPHNTPKYIENGQYPCIRTSDLVDGYLAISQTTKYIDGKEYTERIKRHKPYAGDIIYSREGERFGIAAIVPDNLTVCLGQRVMLFVPQKDQATSEYLWGALNSDSVYALAKNSVGGATSPHVNVKDIQNFKIVSPPLNLQNKFADFVRAADKSKFAMRCQLEAAESSKSSLMQQFFN